MIDDGRARDAAQVLFDYLYLRSPEIGSADAVIGFGHFDLKIPRRCLALHRSGLAPLIVFSGGMGAGTADLGQAEARAFLDEIRAAGGVDEGAVVFEDRSDPTAGSAPPSSWPTPTGSAGWT